MQEDAARSDAPQVLTEGAQFNIGIDAIQIVNALPGIRHGVVRHPVALRQSGVAN